MEVRGSYSYPILSIHIIYIYIRYICHIYIYILFLCTHPMRPPRSRWLSPPYTSSLTCSPRVALLTPPGGARGKGAGGAGGAGRERGWVGVGGGG